MNQRSEGILSPSQPAWMAEAVKINRDENGRRKPRKANQEARQSVQGQTFKFEEITGNGSVFMGAEIRADARGTQVAFHPELAKRLKDVTHNVNWSTAPMALADYAMDQLKGKRVTFVARDADKGTGPLVTYTLADTRGTRIVMEGKMPVCGNEGRRRVAVPLDVRRRIEAAIDDTLPFSHAVMALTCWALDDLKRRKKTLVVPKREGEEEA